MPEPTHIVSILTPDQRGIIHRIVGALHQVDAQHLEISQTVVQEAFTIALVVALPDGRSVDELTTVLSDALGDQSRIAVIPFSGASLRDHSRHYVLTAIGRPAKGAVFAITGLLLERGGNFTDFSSRIVDGNLQLLAEVDLPADVELDQLQIDLQHACDDSALTVRLQHPRLFEATNEIAYRRDFHA